MGHISLPDTAVIDISVIQTIVNAINRLDTQVSELVETYVDVAYSDTDTQPNAWNSGFNPTVHQIQFGKIKVTSDLFVAEGTAGSGDGVFYTATKPDIMYQMPFAEGTKPTVTFGISHGDTNEMSVSLIENANNKFTAKVRATAAGNPWIHWIAIGTRA